MAFTGKGTAVRLGSSDTLNRSQERMSDLMMRADEIRLKAFKENQADYLKLSDLPMESYISDANSQTQAKLIDEYNTKAQEILKERGGSFENFKSEDWLALQKGRRFLEAEQARMNTDLERFKEMDKMVQSRPDTWDVDEWNQIKTNYLRDGRLPNVQLPVKAQPLDFSRDQAVGTETLEYGEPFKYNNTWSKQGTYYSATEQEAREHVKNRIFGSEAKRKWILKEFQDLPESKKLEYLDANSDGKLSSSESQQGLENVDNNPILRYAQDKYWKSARKTREGAMTSAEPPRASGSRKPISAGVRRNEPIQQGSETYNDPYEFDGSHKIGYVPTRNAKEVGGTVTLNLTDKTNVEGFLKFYDAEKDVVLVNTTGSDPDVKAGVTIEVPAKDFRYEDIKNLPVMVDGKQTTIEQVRANKTKPTAQVTKKKAY